MGRIEELMAMAKSAAGVASKKTGEVVESGKLMYQSKQIEWEIEKAYAKLGAIVYEAQKSEDDFEQVIQMAVGEIDELKVRYEDCADKLRAQKNVQVCPQCGYNNELSAFFCNRCGAMLTGEQPEEDAAAKAQDETTTEEVVDVEVQADRAETEDEPTV